MYFAETKSFETYHLRVSAIYPVSAATLQHVVGIESLEALSLTALLRNGSSFFLRTRNMSSLILLQSSYLLPLNTEIICVWCVHVNMHACVPGILCLTLLLSTLFP